MEPRDALVADVPAERLSEYQVRILTDQFLGSISTDIKKSLPVAADGTFPRSKSWVEKVWSRIDSEG